MTKGQPASHICKVLKEHAEKLKDDPERLRTDFIVDVYTNEIDKEFESVTTNIQRDDKEFDKDRLIEIARINKIERKKAKEELSAKKIRARTVGEAIKISRGKKFKMEREQKRLLVLKEKQRAKIKSEEQMEQKRLLRLEINQERLLEKIAKNKKFDDKIFKSVDKAKEKLNRKKRYTKKTKPKSYGSIFRKNTGWD